MQKKCREEVSEFTKHVQVSQEKYHGGDYEGNEIDKMLNNIEKLEEIVDDDHKDFIDAFRSVQELNEHVTGKDLKEGYEEVIDRFTVNFLYLNSNHNVSITPKVHIIMAHLKDYCNETGKSLGSCSDQTIEAVHQLVNNRFTRSNYYIKCEENEKHPSKMFDGVHHVNSYNV